MFAASFLHFAILAIQLSASPPPFNISICDFVHPRKLTGKRITINAMMAFGSHGAYVFSDSCASNVPGAVVLYPKFYRTPRVTFDLDPQVDQLLKPFYRPLGGVAYACGNFTGQLFYKRIFWSRMLGAGPQGNGYGSRGASRLAFVLQSVSEIHACDRPEDGK